ncbi:hypothetical protein H0G86_010244 [Trichoderma simmonsii]|uniref:Uncharacterized protein n=1 Tax=Trichoderma simmonsii TaxID=1491479 RepID=A0A8G0PI04_9HYPO|nr:hypothetical protein H0G86_010244 [Trichoderma simmonsii]
MDQHAVVISLFSQSFFLMIFFEGVRPMCTHPWFCFLCLCMDKQGCLDIGWQTDMIICNYWWNALIADQDRVVSSPHNYVQKLALSIATLSEAPGLAEAQLKQ